MSFIETSLTAFVITATFGPLVACILAARFGGL